jgi:hypothetical protein
VDVTSDSKANYITKLALGYSTSIVVDIAFLIEAQDRSELPESIDGVVRFNRTDLTKHKYIPTGASLGYRQVEPKTPKAPSTAASNSTPDTDSASRRRRPVGPSSLRNVTEEVS